jgi:serine/threonine protein kinase
LEHLYPQRWHRIFEPCPIWERRSALQDESVRSIPNQRESEDRDPDPSLECRNALQVWFATQIQEHFEYSPIIEKSLPFRQIKLAKHDLGFRFGEDQSMSTSLNREMSQPQPLPITIEQLRESDYMTQVAVVCDAFEDTWNRGVHPCVRDYAALASPSYQSRILRELILTERECFQYLDPPRFFLDPLTGTGGEQRRIANTDPTVNEVSDETMVQETILSQSPAGQALPSHIDRFAITCLLGKGSYGTVYEAEDVEIRRRVAIKIANPSNGAEQPFAREAASVSRVKHPAFVPVLEIGQWRGVHYMVSELVQGENLQQHCQKNCVGMDESVSIMIELADAVASAHDCEIVHRDLKPANILIEPMGVDSSPPSKRVRVLDFGIAKHLDRSTSSTIAGDIVGTPHYMSPEQARGESSSVDSRSDIFSLGVIFFELLLNRRPFEGSPIAAVLAIRDLDAPSVRSIDPRIPMALDAVVEKCLKRDRFLRYQNAYDLAKDLRLYRDGLHPTVLKSKRRKSLARMAVAVSFIVIAALTLALALNRIGAPKTNSLAANLNIESQDHNPIIEMAGIKTWIERGRLENLNQWLHRYQQGDLNARSDLDEVRFTKVQNPQESERREFAQACILSETDSSIGSTLSSTLQKLDLESQSDAFCRFVQLAPISVLDRCNVLAFKWVDISVRNALARKLSQRWSRENHIEPFLAAIRKAETQDLIHMISGMDVAIDSKEVWYAALCQELETCAYEPLLSETKIEASARWRAKLFLVAYQLGYYEMADAILDFNPLPQARSYFIYWLSRSDTSLAPLIDRLPMYRDEWCSSGVVQCILNRYQDREEDSGGDDGNGAGSSKNELRSQFRSLYREHASCMVHRLARTMLQSLEDSEFIQSVDQSAEAASIRSDRNWFVNSLGMRMSIVRGPVEFWFGNAPNHPIPGSQQRIAYSFAYSDELVSEESYATYEPSKYGEPSNAPDTNSSWMDAVRFCDWLSRREGLSEFESLHQLSAESWEYKQSERGYRLPTVWEWECLMRAGTATSLPYGQEQHEFANESTGFATFDILERTSTQRSQLLDDSAQSVSFDVSALCIVKGLLPDNEKRNGLERFKLSKMDRKRALGFRLLHPLLIEEKHAD